MQHLSLALYRMPLLPAVFEAALEAAAVVPFVVRSEVAEGGVTPSCGTVDWIAQRRRQQDLSS